MFGDVAPALIAYLADRIEGVRVVSRVPDPRPPRLLQVRRVGGAAVPPVRETVRLDIQAWDTSDPAAMQLALAARTHVWALAGTSLLGAACYRVEELLAPRLDDDPVTNSPVAWATYSLLMRADDAVPPTP
ncbi:hypothetical protein [Streptomyces thermolilacinus]|uniref:hypothetical protein n=1 Tax=Streptomyces thermolilacinus TaxID=285540 RepID=UPI0033F44874